MVGYPLDTVKVHMQTQDCRNPKYRGTWDCLRTILAKESVFMKTVIKLYLKNWTQSLVAFTFTDKIY